MSGSPPAFTPRRSTRKRQLRTPVQMAAPKVTPRTPRTTKTPARARTPKKPAMTPKKPRISYADFLAREAAELALIKTETHTVDDKTVYLNCLREYSPKRIIQRHSDDILMTACKMNSDKCKYTIRLHVGDANSEAFKREVRVFNVLSSMRDWRAVHMRDYCFTDDDGEYWLRVSKKITPGNAIVMNEWHGTLAQLDLKQMESHHITSLLRDISWQIRRLHMLWYIHWNITPENILYRKVGEYNYEFSISDFRTTHRVNEQVSDPALYTAHHLGYDFLGELDFLGISYYGVLDYLILYHIIRIAGMDNAKTEFFRLLREYDQMGFDDARLLFGLPPEAMRFTSYGLSEKYSLPLHPVKDVRVGDESFMLSMLCVKDYKIKKVIGSGAFGSVMVACKRDSTSWASDCSYIIKLQRDPRSADNFAQEVEVLTKLGADPRWNGVKMLEHCQTNDQNTMRDLYLLSVKVYGNIIVMDRWKGDLTRLNMNGGILNTVLTQLSTQIKVLHDIGYIHWDLFRKNILYKNSRKSQKGGSGIQISIADFGMTRQDSLPPYEPDYYYDVYYFNVYTIKVLTGELNVTPALLRGLAYKGIVDYIVMYSLIKEVYKKPAEAKLKFFRLLEQFDQKGREQFPGYTV